MAKKILIIDDEEDMRIYLETIFQKAGYDTMVAVNGDEALAMVSNYRPDLITLDILMPRRSGLSFYTKLREQAETRNLPVIVVSGIAGNDQFFESDNRNAATVFLEKPIERSTLLEQVERLTGT